MTTFRLAVLTLAVVWSCAAVPPSPAEVEPTPSTHLTFFVHRAVEGKGRVEPVAGAAALLVVSGTVQAVGVTGESGTVSIEKEMLARPDASAILFCQGEGWSCNAVRLDVDRDAVIGVDELSMELAGGLQNLDRQPAKGKARRKVTDAADPEAARQRRARRPPRWRSEM